MNESLFNNNKVTEIIQRINSVTAESKPIWGKMNAAQLMAHCAGPLKMAKGEIKGKRGLLSYLLGKYSKKNIVNPAIPFSKNLPTDPNFIFPATVQFEAEKQILINTLLEFSKNGPEAISKDPHSFFGPMSPQDWDILLLKHFDHHLRQFGA